MWWYHLGCLQVYYSYQILGLFLKGFQVVGSCGDTINRILDVHPEGNMKS